MKKVTLGGDRLGSGKKQKVDLQGFERSTHDLSNAWRSTMSAGTLVPFMIQPAMPGDVWEIKLDADVMTHPTLGPLLGSEKVQLDMFTIPMRLYNSWVHNNKLGIGNNMSQVKMPKLTINSVSEATTWSQNNPTKYPINNSHVLKYLGISGPRRNTSPTHDFKEEGFGAIPLLGYWDIFKNYYANKQEENAWVISTPVAVVTDISKVFGGQPSTGLLDVTVTPMSIESVTGTWFVILLEPVDQTPANWNIPITLEQVKFTDGAVNLGTINDIAKGSIVYEAPVTPIPNNIYVSVQEWGGKQNIWIQFQPSINADIDSWNQSAEISYRRPPQLYPFSLTEIDDIREAILGTRGDTTFFVNEYGYDNDIELIKRSLPDTADLHQRSVLPLRYNQEGLLVKTYQSDIFNNWLNTETISGSGGVNEITRVDTTAGYFNIDTLQLAYKVYRMLNQITVSGGSYDDWQNAVYDHERFAAPEIPMYEGGLSKELVFQEIYSSNTQEGQPLGTLAGKGRMSGKHKGGHVVIHVNELSFIMGIISITPRIDYSQGNDWFTRLSTWNDWHKPHLDQIGFQDLMAEQMAWFGATFDGTTQRNHAVGKQPAWINYMTNYNRSFGNFADQDSEMFMTLNRRYEMSSETDMATNPIVDATSYIDPSKYNFIFAETALDAQNYWVQVATETTVRRKMSAKVMPNL